MNAEGAPTARSQSADPELRLSVAAVAADLAIAPATQRTWDRRYGLGPAEHAAGSHRRYGPDDVARLRLMKRAMLRGASPAEAARYALAADPSVLSTLVADEHGTAPPASTGGRATASVDSDGGAAGELAVAALALDARTMQQLLSRSVTQRGIAKTWEFVIRPVLGAAGDRWADTGAGVEIEHVLSECVTALLARLLAETPENYSSARVLLAGMPGELHDLPLRALGAVLAEQGAPLIMLGADTPAPALTAAVRARQPSAVFLWAETDRSADLHLLDQLPPNRYLLGGPAWDRVPLPADVCRVRDLADAADRLLALVCDAADSD